MSSVSRRIARDGVSKGRKIRQNEITPASLAIALGVDVYHARIALRGTSISPSLIEVAMKQKRAAEQAEQRAELDRLVGAKTPVAA